MIIDIGGRRSVSVDHDRVSARYDCARTVTGTAAASASAAAGTVRLIVEIKRNLGGMIMRAAVGGEFRSGGDGTRFEVCVTGEPFDSGVPATCDSPLGTPLVPGLPADFADAVLGGLMADAEQAPLPGGVLRVDRAGYDLMGSSDAAFGLAAKILRHAVALSLQASDLDKGVRAVFETIN
jgi:hypothetical protein